MILNILRDTRDSPFPLYVVVDYFKRVEFQQCRSPRMHALLWLDNALVEEAGMNMPKTIEITNMLTS